MKKTFRFLMIFGMALAAACSASAATQQSNLPVSVNVLPTCSVDTVPVDFGDYTNDVRLGEGYINVTCAHVGIHTDTVIVTVHY